MRLKIFFVAFLTATILLSLPACFSEKESVFFMAKLSANPAEIEEGQTSKITVTGQNFPSDITYKWRASGGTCNPPISQTGETIFQAASLEGPDNQRPAIILVEFIVNGVRRGEQSLDLVVKRRGVSGAATPVSPSPAVTVVPAASPKVEITKSGVFDPVGGQFPGETIEGKVSGVDPKDYRIILFSLAAGTWFIQPYRDGDGRFTEIDSNLNFTNTYHTGRKYAALLCRRTYDDPPATTITLPLNNPNVVAFSIVDGANQKK